MQINPETQSIKTFVKLKKELIKEAITTARKPLIPTLYIIQVGQNEASTRYVRNKIKDCEEVGFKANLIALPEATTTETICNYIDKVANEGADGIIVQLPLPKHIDKDVIIKHIPPELDVDGFGPETEFEPCTPLGILEYLQWIKFDLDGKHAVILGRSDIVGRPMAKMLQLGNCTTTLCNSHTPKELRDRLLRNADLVICAVGKRNFISSQDALNAFIVDVGINFDENGKLCGDVDVNPLDKNRVTPVPGGVGLLTRLALLENTLESACLKI